MKSMKFHYGDNRGLEAYNTNDQNWSENEYKISCSESHIHHVIHIAMRNLWMKIRGSAKNRKSQKIRVPIHSEMSLWRRKIQRLREKKEENTHKFLLSKYRNALLREIWISNGRKIKTKQKMKRPFQTVPVISFRIETEKKFPESEVFIRSNRQLVWSNSRRERHRFVARLDRYYSNISGIEL